MLDNKLPKPYTERISANLNPRDEKKEDGHLLAGNEDVFVFSFSLYAITIVLALLMGGTVLKANEMFLVEDYTDSVIIEGIVDGKTIASISFTLPREAYLTVASDSAFVPWILEAQAASMTLDKSEEFATYCETAAIKKPVAYVNWPMFKEALKEYPIYAADRTSGFTPADVEGKLFPLLDALEMKALLVEMEHKGKTLVFTIRSAN